MEKHRKTLAVLLVLTCIIISACDVEWIGWGGEDDDEVTPAGETLITTAIATVDIVYATEMDVITDDDVLFTCDLPVTPLLVEGDLVYITIDFESRDDSWVIMDVRFDEKIM